MANELERESRPLPREEAEMGTKEYRLEKQHHSEPGEELVQTPGEDTAG